MPTTLEIPTGTINGTNTLFTVNHNIDEMVITVNGLIYPSIDTYYGFTFTGSIFTMNNAPLTDDVILVDYKY